MVSIRRVPAERFAIHLVNLDPAFGVEMKKTRPCVVVSPAAMHRHVLSVIVVPMTTAITQFPTRVPCRFAGRNGELALDQMRSVDALRLGKRLGKLDAVTAKKLLDLLAELFS